MWLSMIKSILSFFGFRLLGAGVVAAVDVLRGYGLKSEALDYVNQLVQSAEKNPSLKDGDAKFAWVEAQAWGYLAKNYPDMSKKSFNWIVETLVGLLD